MFLLAVLAGREVGSESTFLLLQIMRHPWYMHGLPLDALKYNDEYLNTSPHSQNMARNCQSCVQSIVEEARTQVGHDAFRIVSLYLMTLMQNN